MDVARAPDQLPRPDLPLTGFSGQNFLAIMRTKLVDMKLGLIFLGSGRSLLNRSFVSMIANTASLSAYLKKTRSHLLPLRWP